MTPRLLIVSYLGRQPLPSPRAERTARLTERLAKEWEIRLLTGPVAEGQQGYSTMLARRLRVGLGTVSRAVLLDRFEPWSRRAIAGEILDADAALLIGFPFSPVAVAARRLAARGMPYVVDAGDPWVLTAASKPNHGIGLIRARRAESFVWQHARGAVLTTPSQARALGALFPNLDMLVRPNGFVPVPPGAEASRRADHADVLRLAHFGLVSKVRLDVSGFLECLAHSGRWNRVEFHQFGPDWSDGLAAVPRVVRVVRHEPRPWAEVVAIAREYDAALVIGNRNGSQLPSKAIDYMTLPVPRIALVGDSRASLAEYVEHRSGWLVATPGDRDLAPRVDRHVSHPWSCADLDPPPSESWDEVAKQITAFVGRAVRSGSGREIPAGRRTAACRALRRPTNSSCLADPVRPPANDG